MAQEHLVWRKGAQKYEAGTHNLAGLVGLVAALEMILELGIDEITGQLLRLRAVLIPGLLDKGYTVLQAEAPPAAASALLSFYRPGADLVALHNRLLQSGVITSLRTDRAGQNYIRLSPHFYNTEAELRRVLEMM
ncbi:Aminotransferase class V (fragment) [Verrucomicrobia bacterium]